MHLACSISVRRVVIYVPTLSDRSLDLLEGVLFTDIRFHDTISRGTLLNRFGKDFESEIRHCRKLRY